MRLKDSLKRVQLYLNTLKYLKATQIYFRLYYKLRGKLRDIFNFSYPKKVEAKSYPLKLEPSIYLKETLRDNNCFNILNLTHSFKDGIDWDFIEYGKLWSYNLNYFEFLNQKSISKEQGLKLIRDFLSKDRGLKVAFEPYVISLRVVNWIKFLTYNRIRDKKIDSSLYASGLILLDNIEYQILGNHILENGFGLLFLGVYFKDKRFYLKAKEILIKELKRQILRDGAHFELSPMYHQIILFRLLDSINLLSYNTFLDSKELKLFLEDKAKLMLSWLEAISFSSGDIPLFNDSAKEIAPTTKELKSYALRVGLKSLKLPLLDSGYRKIKRAKYELILDIADIKASYIPGHTHADTFSFELYIDNSPFIVDKGISTYEDNPQRYKERSTLSHNSVEVLNSNSSEVWASFRLANRAKVINRVEEDNFIEATHSGYKKRFNILHTRKWSFRDDSIIIEDMLNKKTQAIARFHFHPNITKEEILKRVEFDSKSYRIKRYSYAPTFNTLIEAYSLEIDFQKDLRVVIKI